MRPFLSNSRCFRYDLHLETAEEIASCVYHCFRTMPTPPWLCGKEHCLTGTQMGVTGPEKFALLAPANFLP